jgi:outer membrane protein OmpA-like peptidoglycan-associated protein
VVGRAGGKLFGAGAASLGSAPRVLVIDPLIDAATGQQTMGSVQMGRQLAEIVQSQYPMWTVRPLTRDVLTDQPLLLIGTLTAINTKKAAAEPADAFGICLRLVDLRTGKVVARNADRATVDSVNAEPTPYFRDSPTWSKDKTTSAYIKSCQGTALGDAVDPVYLLRLPAAAVLNEALAAYTANRLSDAYRLYREAAIVAEPDDLRVLNGQYLTSWRSGRRTEAAQVFDKIVQAGFDANRLPLKLLFSPGGTTLLSSGDLQAQYTMWLRAVGRHSSAGGSCLQVVGHTSHTGSAELNDALSERRALFVQSRLQAAAPALGRRIATQGVGWRENLIGLGTDDLRDALDRRVEFHFVSCPAG